MFRLNRYLLVFVLFIWLFTLASIAAQETTPPAEPPTEAPTLEPPTAEPPTLEPPTFEPPTSEPPTSEPPTVEPPTLAPPTETATLESPTETFTETATATSTATLESTATATTTATSTSEASITPSFTPSATTTAAFTPTIAPTAGIPNYSATLQAWNESQAMGLQSQNQLLNTCATSINSSYSIVAPPSLGNPSTDFYTAVAQAHSMGAASPYPIYLCEGTFPLHETVGFSVDVEIYGRGVGESIFTQSNYSTMGHMFVIDDFTFTTVEFHHVTFTQALNPGGAGVIKIWGSSSLRIFDSQFIYNQGAYNGGIEGGGLLVYRSIFEDNLASTGNAGAIGSYTLEAECVRFENNSTAENGGAIFMVENAEIHNSSFIGNSAVFDGNQIYAQGWYIDAQNNYWATTPTVPDEVTNTVDTSSPLLTDPTSHYATGDYYALTTCAMAAPVPLPGGICEPSLMGRSTLDEDCITPSPSPTFTPSPTPTPSVFCIFEGQYLYPYRAPITNNQPLPQIPYSSQYNLMATHRFVEHVNPLSPNPQIWYYIEWAELDSNPTQNDDIGVWIQAPNDPPIGGNGCNNGNGLPIDSTYTIPAHPWSSFTGTFGGWPVDISSICHIDTNTEEIHALGINPPSGASYPRGTHNGIDLFVPQAQANIEVRSMSPGIVVGIGYFGDTTNTHAMWGASNQDTGTGDIPGYSVIVRHGHLYVLYGHLASISETIWVGAGVNTGTILGTVGVFNERHLHVEVHSYGDSVGSITEGNTIGETGILPVNLFAAQIVAPYVYDIMQFLPDPSGYSGGSSIQTLVSTNNLNTTGTEGQINLPFNASCDRLYRTKHPDLQAVIVHSINNYRGFVAYGDESRALLSPLTQTVQP